MTMQITTNGQAYTLSSKFREAGQDLLVFVHGLGCSKEAYDAAWHHPGMMDFSLLSFDLLGFGESPKPMDFAYSLGSHAQVLGQVLSYLGDYRIHLVANSWGPLIGLLLPNATLTNLASFVNLEGRMVIDDVGNAKKAASVVFEEFEAAMLPEMKAKYGNDSKTAYRLDQALPLAYYNGAKSIVEVVGRGEFPEKFVSLACPKVYFYGDQNKHLKSLTVISSVPAIEISNAGHFMMKDNSEEFYLKLTTFLDQSGKETR